MLGQTQVKSSNNRSYNLHNTTTNTQSWVVRTMPDYVTPESYIVYIDGSTVYAVNGKTGAVDYSGSSAATVIQSAVNALTSGGMIVLKAGSYTFNAIVEVKSNRQIVGEGYSTKITVGTDVYGAFKVTDTSTVENVRISNICIDGNKTNQTDASNNTGLIVLDTYKTVRNIYIDHMWFENAFFSDIVNVGPTTNPTGIHISNIYSTGCGDVGSGYDPHSLYLTNVEDSYVQDYYVTGCDSHSFDIRTTGKRSVFVRLHSYSPVAGFGLSLYTQDAVFIGCKSFNAYEHGIRLSGCSRTALIGCVVMNSSQGPGTQDGILITGSSTNNIILGCICSDDQATKTQRYGINIPAESNYNIICACQLSGNATGGLNDNGTNNVKSANIL